MLITEKGQVAPCAKARKLLAASLLAALTACGGGGGGGSSDAGDSRASEVTPTPAPATNLAPSNLSYNITANDHVALAWNDNSADEVAFNIFRQTVDSNVYERKASLAANTTHWTDTNVNGGDRYRYFVSAELTSDDLDSTTIITNEIPTGVSSAAAMIYLPDGFSGDGENMYIDPDTRNEDNDTSYGAFAIPKQGDRNSTIIGAVTKFDDDQTDFFQITLEAGTGIHLTASDDTVDNADADLYLYDDQLNLVDASLSSKGNESLTAPTAGNYFIEVVHQSGDRLKYALSFSDENLGASNHPFSLNGNLIIGEYIISAPRLGLLQTLGILGHIVEATLEGLGLLKITQPELLLNNPLIGLYKLDDYYTRRQKITDDQQRARYDSIMLARALESLLGTWVEPNVSLGVAGISTNDSRANRQWAPEQIGAENAWNTTTGSEDVRVAVIDTGFLLDHRDLKHAFIDGWNYVDENNDPSATSELSLHHGTHVAGIIAAQKDNNQDIAGIAPDVKLIPIKIMEPNCVCGSSYNALQGMRWAAGLDNSAGTKATKPAQIISLSIEIPTHNSTALRETVDAVREAGSVVVWAAGNDHHRLDVDASHSLKTDGLILVSASGLYGKLASYSNYGNAVDVIAPGGDYKAESGGERIHSLYGHVANDGSESYGSRDLHGTSQATPHVSGVLALMASVWPNFSPSRVESLLQDEKLTQDTGAMGRDDYHGWGRIDAEKAVEAAAAEANNPSDMSQDSLRLAAMPSELDFGGRFETLNIDIEANQTDLESISISYKPDWATATRVDTDANGLGSWKIEVDRSEFTDERYNEVIIFVSGDKKLYLPVSAHGENYLPRGTGIAKMLVEFLNPETKRREHRVTAEIDNNQGFSFDASDVPAGEYIIRASSDLDNNGFYCEVGEFCGYLKADPEETTVIENGASLNGSSIALSLIQ